MPNEAARLGPEPAPANIPDHIKLALNYAEESSKRARWIIFIIQIAAVLVLASVWQEANFNWLSLRLTAAQRAVHYLECNPQKYYPLAAPSPGLSSAKPPDALKELSAEISKTENGGFMPLSREELDIAYSCAANPLSVDDEKKARDYVKAWNYSLPQARKNVADLQQMMGNRVLAVGVPVLGIVFDINDLSIVAGITFSILLSWFYYNVRRQDKNTNHVFEMAEKSKIEVDGRTMLDTTYHLLRMTQILTIPPGREPDSRDVTTLRLLTRLPNLILWTATLAQAIVLVEDLSTVNDVAYLHPFAGRAETAFALYLFAFILYQTIRCIHQQVVETTEIWVTAWNKINKEKKGWQIHPKPPLFEPLKKWWQHYKKAKAERRRAKEAAVPQRTAEPSQETQESDKDSRKEQLPILIGLGVLELVIAAHLLDEWRPDLWRTMASGFAGSPKAIKLSLIWAWPERFSTIIAMLAVIIVALRVWRGKKENIPKAQKWVWTLPALALAEILIHWVKGKMGLFHSFMEGFYSTPMILLASIVLLYLLRERPEKVPEESAKPEVAAKAAAT